MSKLERWFYGLKTKQVLKHYLHLTLSVHNGSFSPGPSLFCSCSLNSVSTLRGSYGDVKAGAWSGCSRWSAAFYLSIQAHFDCAGSRKVWSPVRSPVLVCGISLVNSRIKCWLCNVQVHLDCAGSRKVLSPVLACGILLVNSRAKWVKRPIKCILTSQARTNCGPRSWSAAFCL